MTSKLAINRMVHFVLIFWINEMVKSVYEYEFDKQVD